MTTAPAYNLQPSAPEAPGQASGGAGNIAQRTELARRLTDVLALPSGQVNDHERAFTADMLNELLHDVTLAIRVEVAERLAQVLPPPAMLLRRLLLEPIEVAGPLLKAYRSIPEGMLIEAARRSEAHRRAIAQRISISDVVADVIFEEGDVSLVVQLLQREELVIAEYRIDELVSRSMSEPAICGPLMQRLELQPRHGFTMFWWLCSEDRQKILARFSIERTVVQDALKKLFCEVFPDPEPDLVVKRILVLCDRRHRPRGKNGEAVSIDVVEKMLVRARAHPRPELVQATGLLAGVEATTAHRVMMDEGPEPFAVMAKSVGVSRGAFRQILEKAQLAQSTDGSRASITDLSIEESVAVFDSMARDYARTILRYWDWRMRITREDVAP
ncbi:hypothetical protein PB2503_03247 [Parvularcula bermudensis HTCC2503]|uniref:DUF2336 domain-containing protein n=1 Tax=Parvularcula bermudensis (strain ATCC BAA-594 / HTCC2503 / KCTC 12087) TaxID=314260 RepID=E0TD67_PARBH|nr:DUF2336 domain-containing protein [Parvularcula bermudensis]ADM08726.1 hypothetical protein PB2503_03247 [Parvularcula bermudensis HTCC2503]